MIWRKYCTDCCLSLIVLSRSASFSQSMPLPGSIKRNGETSVQKSPRGYSHCVNGINGQIHGFHSLPKPSKHHMDQRDTMAYDLPRSLGSDDVVRYGSSGLDNDDEAVYTFNTPNSTLCRRLSEVSTDSYDVPSTPLSIYHIPRTFTFDKNHNTLSTGSGDSASAPPPRPPKPAQVDWKPERNSPKQHSRNAKSKQTMSAATIPRRNTVPAVDSNRLHRGKVFWNNMHSKFPLLTSGVSPPYTRVWIKIPSLWTLFLITLAGSTLIILLSLVF